MNSPYSRPALFYDGSCPLCSREISTMRSKSQGALLLIDIYDLCEQSWKANWVSKRELLEQLHLLMPNGQLLKGLDANIAAWKFAGGNKLMRVFEWPILYWLAKLGYFIWAKRRFRRLYCNSNGCNDQLA